jgi:hypothetical protein
LADAIETALGGGLAWTLLFAHIDYTSAVATMAQGGNYNGFLPVNRRTDCNCVFPLAIYPRQTLLAGSWEVSPADFGHLDYEFHQGEIYEIRLAYQANICGTPDGQIMRMDVYDDPTPSIGTRVQAKINVVGVYGTYAGPHDTCLHVEKGLINDTLETVLGANVDWPSFPYEIDDCYNLIVKGEFNGIGVTDYVVRFTVSPATNPYGA